MCFWLVLPCGMSLAMLSLFKEEAGKEMGSLPAAGFVVGSAFITLKACLLLKYTEIAAIGGSNTSQ